MQIAFTGAHSTGKTTLLNHMIEKDMFKDFFISTNLSRSLKELGYEISEKGNDTTQLKLLELATNNLIRNYNVLSDRSLIDIFVYTEWQFLHGQASEEVRNLTFNFMCAYIEQYDILFYIRPEFELVDDGLRSTDLEYRDDIANIFSMTIDMLNNHYNCNIVELSGSVEERNKQIDERLADLEYCS